mgnify:CR=1 FL=1
MVNQLLKIFSFFYLICLTIVFLIPLDTFIVTQIVEVKNQPSNDTSYFIHFVLFFILYFILYFAFLNKYKILIFCIIYAILIEILQIFNTRGFQIHDIIFNIMGLTISFIFLNFLFKYINQL